jgi:hypothetical protein
MHSKAEKLRSNQVRMFISICLWGRIIICIIYAFEERERYDTYYAFKARLLHVLCLQDSEEYILITSYAFREGEKYHIKYMLLGWKR